jgi:hypothetical protein
LIVKDWQASQVILLMDHRPLPVISAPAPASTPVVDDPREAALVNQLAR